VVGRPAEVDADVGLAAALREKIAAEAERCGRSFDGQLIALLRGHYEKDIDIAPNPAEILALAAASLADIPAAELRSLTPKLQEPETSTTGLLLHPLRSVL